jgi:hypothetical protein
MFCICVKWPLPPGDNPIQLINIIIIIIIIPCSSTDLILNLLSWLLVINNTIDTQRENEMRIRRNFQIRSLNRSKKEKTFHCHFKF